MTLFANIPAPIARYLLGQLHKALPPPSDDDPNALEMRNIAAQVSIARLAPMNTAEAQLAVHAVACEMHAQDALQDAVRHQLDVKVRGQCRAQSALMIRQAMQVRKELRMMQDIRHAAEQRRQEEIEAAEREAAATAEQTDEVVSPPFMRRLAHRRQTGMDRPKYQNMRQNPTKRSIETESGAAGPVHLGGGHLGGVHLEGTRTNPAPLTAFTPVTSMGDGPHSPDLAAGGVA